MKKTLSGMPQSYELRITKTQAARILAPFPLPKVAHETVAASRKLSPQWGERRAELTVANFGGAFALTCCDKPREQWREFFCAPGSDDERLAPMLAQLIQGAN